MKNQFIQVNQLQRGKDSSEFDLQDLKGQIEYMKSLNSLIQNKEIEYLSKKYEVVEKEQRIDEKYEILKNFEKKIIEQMKVNFILFKMIDTQIDTLNIGEINNFQKIPNFKESINYKSLMLTKIENDLCKNKQKYENKISQLSGSEKDEYLIFLKNQNYQITENEINNEITQYFSQSSSKTR